MARFQAARPAILVALTIGLALPVSADPNPQLAHSVAARAKFYHVDIDPAALTTAQAAALHLLFVSPGKRLDKRRRAEAILRNPDFAD